MSVPPDCTCGRVYRDSRTERLLPRRWGAVPPLRASGAEVMHNRHPARIRIRRARDMTAAMEALKRLQDGNRRLVEGVQSVETLLSRTRRHERGDDQRPFAVILGCSDSRVPVEIVFDQGLGDLFVIRVAGNVVASSQVGSVE